MARLETNAKTTKAVVENIQSMYEIYFTKDWIPTHHKAHSA